jgi:hypothetical protein
MELNHCPTCGRPWEDEPDDEECAAILPSTEHDVIPIRCRALRSAHPDPHPTHWHPPIWPGTPDLTWDIDGPPLVTPCPHCGHRYPADGRSCPRCGRPV